MSPTTQAAAEQAAARPNGAPTLSERVKGLRLGDQVAGGKVGGGSSWIPWTLCLIMAVTWASFAIRAYTTGGLKAILGSGSSSQGSASDGPKGEKPRSPSGGATAPAGEMVLPVKGYIVAAHQIQVSPIEVSGRIEKLFIEEGKFFKKGDPLAVLDRTPFVADYSEAEAALANARARHEELEKSWPLEVEQAEAQLRESIALRDQYESDFKRYEDIRRRSGASVVEKEYELAKYSFYTQSAKVKQMEVALRLTQGPRKQKIDAAAAEVKQAQARFDRAKWRLGNTTIVAPVDGIILTKRAEVGNLVNALAMNTALNAGVCDMADLTDLEVDLEIQERDISKVFVNQHCTLIADAYPQWRYEARVDRILPVANSSKAIVPVRVKVRVPRKEEGQRLRPQMGVVVNFYNEKAPPEPPEAPDPTKIE